MKRYSILIRIVSSFLTIVFLLQMAAESVYALGEGPSQPEAAQFEPVDTTDLVNLATGDFTYTLPVLEVPGPEGGYPLALSYHAGIGTNQEATWVGLGWSLNPGAINRLVSGYPDDYRGDLVTTHFEAKSKKGWGASIGISYGPVGLDLSFDTYQGFGGSLSLSASTNLGRNVRFGPNAAVGTHGGSVGFGASVGDKIRLNIGVNAGTQGLQLSTGVTAALDDEKRWHASQSMVGFSLSSGDRGAQFATSAGGIRSSRSTPGSGNVFHVQYGVPIPTPVPKLLVNLAFSHWKWTLDKTNGEEGYGYIHQASYHESTYGQYDKKYERQLHPRFLYPTQDFYSAAAQGISGSFMPFVEEPYRLYDRKDRDKKGILNHTWDLPAGGTTSYSYTSSNNVKFRFLGDEGSNLISYDGANQNPRWGSPYDNIFQRPSLNYESQRIVPLLDDDGIIEGFRILDAEGKQYFFRQPVYNNFHYTSTKDKTDGLETYTVLGGEYAANWFLTEVTGPDYVDREPYGIVGAEDWGYWVRFVYSTDARTQIWRTPYTAYSVTGASDTDLESWSVGSRDAVYLDSIETATHVAVFRTSLANDRWTSQEVSNLVIHKAYSGGIDVDGTIRRFYAFSGDYVQMLDEVTDNSIEIVGVKYYNTSENGAKKHYRLHKNEIQYYYENGRTVVVDLVHDYDTWITFNTGYAKLRLNNFFPGRYTIARKLDRIDLYQRQDSQSSIKSVAFSYLENGLCPATPSSMRVGQTKLTLKSVRIEGRNHASLMPPYEFEYQTNESFHPDDWDNWGSFRMGWAGYNDRGPDKHSTPQDFKWRADAAKAWSLKGVITPTGGTVVIEYESDDYYHVGGPAGIDFSKAHFLDIPLASRSAGRSVLDFGSVQLPTDAVVGGAAFLYDNRPDEVFGIYDGAFSFFGDLTLLVPSAEDPYVLRLKGLDMNSHHLEMFVQYSDISMAYDPSDNKTTVVVPYTIVRQFSAFFEIAFIAKNVVPKQLQSFTITEINGSVVTLNGQYDFVRNDQWLYHLAIPRKATFGGGIRVKSVTSSDGSTVYKSMYSYRHEDGRSSGVVASLPPLYGEDKRIDDSTQGLPAVTYLESYLDHGHSYGRPAPAVFYSRVEVVNVDETSGGPFNGKTVYEFYTAKDYQYELQTTGNLFEINDKTGIHGKPKSISYYEWTGSNYRTIQREEFLYAFSEDLQWTDAGRGFGRIDIENGQYVSERTRPLGLIQEKYAFRNKYDDNDAEERLVDRKWQNVYIIANRATSYIYDSSTSLNAVSTTIEEKRNFIWDALSGGVIASAKYNSNGKADIQKTVPAHWKYPGMKHRNMLKAVAQTTQYESGVELTSSWDGLADYDFNPDDIISSTVSTWSNHWTTEGTRNDTIWRLNDTYTYNKQIDRAGGSPFSDFNAWNDTGSTYPAVTSSFPWKMASNITKYDRYSHPVEEVSVDQTYTAALYGYGRSMPTAIVTNSPYGSHADGWPRGFSYCGFESFDGASFDGGWGHTEQYCTTEAHTGMASVKISTSDGSQYGPTLDFYIRDGLKNNTKYVISCWVKTASPVFNLVANKNNASPFINGTIAGNMVCQVGDWKLIEFVYPYISGWADGDFLRVFPENASETPAYVDDIRVYPLDASMSTFAYDPLTFQVTSITDANNISTYYEYDAMGRLIAVWDQDKYLRKAHSYQYGRLRYFEPKLSVYGEGGSPILRAGDTTYFHTGATVFPEKGNYSRSYYYFGDGHTLPPNLPNINGASFLGYHVYEGPGHYSVSIDLHYYVGSLFRTHQFEVEIDVGEAPPPPPDE
jgi:YD repeat-containing protein